MVINIFIGSWFSAMLSEQIKLQKRPPDQTIMAFGGGILVGVGAVIGYGCIIGNIVSGWALMSVGSFLFVIITIFTNLITTYIYLIGENPFKISAWKV